MTIVFVKKNVADFLKIDVLYSLGVIIPLVLIECEFTIFVTCSRIYCIKYFYIQVASVAQW